MTRIEVKHLFTFNDKILFYMNIYNKDDDEFCYDEQISNIFKLTAEEYIERIKKVFDKSCLYKGETFLHSTTNCDMPYEQLKKIDEELLDRYREEFTAELTLLILND